MSEEKEYGVLSEDDKNFLANNGYQVICNIGSSYDHLVFKASTASGQLVAIKYLEITNKRKQKYLEREMAITDFLRDNPHKNIVKILANLRKEEENKVFVVMEFGDSGDMVSFFQRRRWTRIDESLARDWFSQLLAAVKWLHDRGIAHRDIKADNVILFSEGDGFRLKLTDLEMAVFGTRRVGRFVQTVKCNTVCGSIEYAAPEIFTMDYNPFVADVYSLGVILYIMNVGISPFKIYGSQLISTNDKIKRTLELKNNRQYKQAVKASDEAKDLINAMLEPNPDLRISLTEVLQSEWLSVETDSYRQFWQMIETED